jgi:NADH-quinone oxidoreductase subunit L
MNLLTVIVLLPLAGFVLNGLLGARLGKQFVSIVGCGLPILAFLAAVRSFLLLQGGDGTALVETAYTWAVVGDFSFDISLYFDRLSAVMTLIITGVGSLIHVYSTGYMKDDASYARYFSYLNLFLFFMLLLVLGRSLLVCFVGWEGVGLASYLLIGFWFEDPEKAAAGKKAFITNRVGDAGFLLGMFLIYHTLGTLEMDRINAAFSGDVLPAVSASLVGILLFIGAMGKSAQIPLHVWLPDAMAGPTPVSALIHAATMVTAGVYLVARLNGIYANAPEAAQLITVIGASTAFFAATVAIVQTDIKKVLAYSTLSQLGFMFVALGVGAYGVAVFHLYTHAFFKACLFLGAGSVIHALSGEQDIRRMGGLAKGSW